MRALLGWMVRLYPQAWRVRYEEEFLEHLQSITPRWTDAWDVARGGLAMSLDHGKFLRMLAWTLPVAVLLSVSIGLWVAPPATIASVELEATEPWRLNLAVRKTFGRQRMKELVEELNLYPEQRKTKPLEQVIASMLKEDLSVEAFLSADSQPRFRLNFKYPDEQLARNGSQMLANLLREVDPGIVASPESMVRAAGVAWWVFALLGAGTGLAGTALLVSMRRPAKQG